MEEIEPKSRGAWRRWLDQHHGAAPGVWLIWHKKRSGRQSINVAEAVQEALCFGWIDSRLRPLDDEKSALLFTPRRRGSAWSRVNKQRVESLIAQGLMADAGLRVIETAKRDGSWNRLDAVEDLRVPDDLAQALAGSPGAKTNFDGFPPSARKMALWWIESAKRPETREKRVSETVRLAAKNLTVAERPRERT